MSPKSALMTTLAVALFLAASPVLAQDDGDATETQTATSSELPSASAQAEADATSELPVCPAGRTTTVSGGACTPATSSVVASPPPSFATIGGVQGSTVNFIHATADAR